MKELKCPQCGNVFKVDEADYASIVSQIKNSEFEAEVCRRIDELKAQQAAQAKVKEAESREAFNAQMQKKQTMGKSVWKERISRIMFRIRGM